MAIIKDVNIGDNLGSVRLVEEGDGILSDTLAAFFSFPRYLPSNGNLTIAHIGYSNTCLSAIIREGSTASTNPLSLVNRVLERVGGEFQIGVTIDYQYLFAILIYCGLKFTLVCGRDLGNRLVVVNRYRQGLGFANSFAVGIQLLHVPYKQVARGVVGEVYNVN